MKIAVLFFFCTSICFAQQKAESESWLIDPAYVKDRLYTVNVGRNPYEALLRALADLSEKINIAQSDKYPETVASATGAGSTIVNRSFGEIKISYFKQTFGESFKNGDTLKVKKIISVYGKLQYAVKSKQCFIHTGSDVTDLASDETFTPTTYESQTNGEQSLSYGFKNMTFSDLLTELQHSRVEIKMKTEFDVTYVLATYPIANMKK